MRLTALKKAKLMMILLTAQAIANILSITLIGGARVNMYLELL